MMKRASSSNACRSLGACVPLTLALMLALPAGCRKDAAPPAQRGPQEVTVLKLEAADTPFTAEFVGQTASSHQVEIRARVNAFLDKRTYDEGQRVKEGQTMFLMDAKPFEAQLAAAKGALAMEEARLRTTQANLARVRPLTQQNALSQKDLDDAIGAADSAVASVEMAKANVKQAELNLSYVTINTPLSGIASYARVQDGAYVNQANSLLTYVAQIDPMWINFSVSENDVLKYRGQAQRGVLKTPKDAAYDIEIQLSDGSVYPQRGKILFADAEYNQQTGTFLVRGSIANIDLRLRPGQFVRVRMLGAVRPNAILVPQQAVQQGAQGHFVWVVDAESKAQMRYVQVGPWYGNKWFIDSGLSGGDTVIVDGFMKLGPGTPVKFAAPPTSAPATASSAPVSERSKL